MYGENMAAEVFKCLKEYKISQKFICITGDNASNNIAMTNELLSTEELQDSKFCGKRKSDDGFQYNYNYILLCSYLESSCLRFFQGAEFGDH